MNNRKSVRSNRKSGGRGAEVVVAGGKAAGEAPATEYEQAVVTGIGEEQQ